MFVYEGFRAQCDAILGPRWANLAGFGGPTSVQVAPRWLQVGLRWGKGLIFQEVFVAFYMLFNIVMVFGVDFERIFNDLLRSQDLENGAPVVAPYTFERFRASKMSNDFCWNFGANMASKIHGKSCQVRTVGPSWAKLVQVGLKLGQVGVSSASLDVRVDKMWFPCALGAQPGTT